MNKYRIATIIGVGLALTGCGRREADISTFYSGNPEQVLTAEQNAGLRNALRLDQDEHIQSALCKDENTRYGDNYVCAFKTDKRTLRLTAYESKKFGINHAILTVNPKADTSDSYLSISKGSKGYHMSSRNSHGKTSIGYDDQLYGKFEAQIKSRFEELAGSMYNLHTGAAGYELRRAEQQVQGALGDATPKRASQQNSTEQKLEEILK